MNRFRSCISTLFIYNLKTMLFRLFCLAPLICSCATTKKLVEPNKPITFLSNDRKDYDGSLTFNQKKDVWILVSSHVFPMTALPVKSELLMSISDDLKKITSTKLIFPKLSKDWWLYHPAFKSFRGQLYLYFMGANKKTKEARFFRSTFSDMSFSSPEKLVIEDNLTTQLRPFMKIDDSSENILLISYQYRDPRSKKFHLKVAESKDGISFRNTIDLGPGIMPGTASFPNGNVVLTHQNGDPENMMDFYHFKKQDGTWSEPKPISNRNDVHDAIPFRRLDGNIDLYYIAPVNGEKYAIWRRFLDSSGNIGDEEQVTFENAGSTEKPKPHRLPDGSIFVTYNRQVIVSEKYEVNGVRLEKDAIEKN